MKSILPDLTNNIPLNITAKRVIQDGVHYSCEIKGIRFHSDIMPRLASKNELKHVMKNPDFKDYTGHKHGYFTVIGLLKPEHEEKKGTLSRAKWVCKCSCGMYEFRS